MKLNKIIFTLTGLVSFAAVADQPVVAAPAAMPAEQQAQPAQPQQQELPKAEQKQEEAKQKPQEKPKPRILWNKHQDNKKKNDEANGKKPDEFAWLADLLQEIVDAVTKENGSVDAMLDQKAKEHVRICPTCGGLAATCPADIGRIQQGIIMTCGCPKCGGLQV